MNASRTIFSALFALFTISPAMAMASTTTMTVAGHYDQAADPSHWRWMYSSNIPEELLQKVTVPTPPRAYQAPYQQVFLQNDRFVICYISCDQPQTLQPTRDASGNFVIDSNGSDTVQITRQTNVYYWMNQLFDRMEQLGFKPTKRLVVMIDRNVQDPTSGIDQADNAFFYDENWTLSFLPAERAYVTELITRMNFSNSANDPSVIMHETTHSVFQALIGKILNQEILGLHEAFADYFSLSIVNSPDIGRFMVKGRAIRTASTLIPYKTGMEAHDLGNVVVAALWNIRQLFKQPLIADRIALETVKQVSLNPYASAGDVVVAHLQALAQFGRAELAANPNLLANIQNIWTQTKLRPTVTIPNEDALHAPTDDSKLMSAVYTIDVPAQLARDYAMPRHDEKHLSLFEQRPGTPGTATTWYRLAYDSSVSSPSFWIFYDGDVGSVYAAYDLSGRAITSTSGDLNRVISLHDDALSDMKELNGLFGQKAISMFGLGFGLTRIGFDSTPIETGSVEVQINGQTVEATELHRSIQANAALRFLTSYDPIEFAAISREVQGVSLITVPAGSIQTTRSLQTYNGEIVVGYRITEGSGVTKSVILTDLR